MDNDSGAEIRRNTQGSDDGCLNCLPGMQATTQAYILHLCSRLAYYSCACRHLNDWHKLIFYSSCRLDRVCIIATLHELQECSRSSDLVLTLSSQPRTNVCTFNAARVVQASSGFPRFFDPIRRCELTWSPARMWCFDRKWYELKLGIRNDEGCGILSFESEFVYFL